MTKVTNQEMLDFENELGRLLTKHNLPFEFHELEKQIYSLRHRLRLYGYEEKGK